MAFSFLPAYPYLPLRLMIPPMENSSPSLKILIIGGYGTFGGRIVELLESLTGLELIVAGRSLDKAKAFCASRGKALASLTPQTFDRNGDIAAQLAQAKADIVVDASGPFQAYGAGCYRVIEGCLEARVNYMDLADGSDFVAGVGAFNEQAKAAGIYILSGVSSFPVLTAAVVRRISADLSRVDSIRGGIAPSPFAGVGENVIRAIAGYSGQPVPLKTNGKIGTGYPLTQTLRYTIAPPGRVPLKNTLFSLVDVPDLRVLTDLWPEANSTWMGAGPVPEILHRALIALSWLVRWKWIKSLTPIAPLMHFATNHLRWGEHRGGMFVEVAGTGRDGQSATRSWHLLAEGSDGPLIPSMAVEALIHRLLAGQKPASGARPATQDLELADYEALFANRTIYTGKREAAPCLYRDILGPAFGALPPEIRHMHEGTSAATGEASVERGSNPLANLIANVIGFPKTAIKTPVTVHFDKSSKGEIWQRRFGADSFHSAQFAGTGRAGNLLTERFGLLNFDMALVVEKNKLILQLRRWNIFGLPLPMWLCPRSNSYETVEEDRFNFHVDISYPLIGQIVRYRGWLKPD